MDGNLSDYSMQYLVTRIPTEIIQKFRQLVTHKERFILFLEYVVRNADVWSNAKSENKGSEHSIRSREDGNKSFMNSQYDEAVQEYTESIVFAVDASEELALAYANRSAALFKLGKYKDCIKDIDRALNLSYPDRLKMKLYKRQGMCLIELGRPGADSSFTQALRWLDKSTLSEDDRNEAKRELMTLVSTPYPTLESPEEPSTSLVAEILQPNPDIPSASDAIIVNYSEEYDRHVVATRRIRPGEVLVDEKLFCKRLRPHNVYTKCSECMRDSWSMIPCAFCVNAAYCSESCKDKAWDEYHEVECPVVGFLLSLDIGDAVCLGLRMAIVAAKKGKQLDVLRQEVMVADANTDPANDGYCMDGKIHSDKFLSIHCNLPKGRVKRFSIDQQMCGVISVAVAVCFLAKESKMFGEKLTLDVLAKNPDVTFIGGLIFKHIHLTQPWTHRLQTNNGEVPLTPRQAKHHHGHALMAVTSLFRHSCDANTIQELRGDQMITIAAHPIEEGEQILAHHGLDYAMLTKDQRMECFKSSKFKCDCLACIEDWPLAYRLPSYRNQPITQQNMKKINTAVQKFKKCRFGTAEDRLRTLNELINLIEILFAFAMKPCKELALINQLMKLCHIEDCSVPTASQKEKERQYNHLLMFQALMSGSMNVFLS